MIGAILGVVIGIIIGFIMPIIVPPGYSLYLAVGILAALDSVIGGLRANYDGKFNRIIFISGFLLNALAASGLAYVGDLMGIPLYYAAVFVFGARLFNNLAGIRRGIISKYESSKKENEHNI